MDTQRLSGLLFLLGSATLAMPGCDTDSDDDTDGGSATDSASGTDSASDATASASGATASDGTASASDSASDDSASDTASDDSASDDSASDSGEDTTAGTATATTGSDDTGGLDDTGDETGVGTIGTSDDTGGETGVSEACAAFADAYVGCYQKYTAEQIQAYCEMLLEYGGTISPGCGDAYADLYNCLATLDCKELMAEEPPAACQKTIDAVDAACGK
ncbi:MAG: hypothetical protein AAGA54_35190 [Myxococcota bacterium]